MVWAAVGAATIGAVGSLVAGGAQRGANADAARIANQGVDDATKAITDAATTGAQVRDKANDDSRDAKLAALAKIGALSSEQLQTITNLINQGQSDYVDTIISTAEGYAGDMADGGKAYRDALTDAGVGYGADMTELVNTYGAQIQQVAQQLGVDLHTAAQIFKDGLEQNAQKYSTDLLSAAQAEADGLDKASTEYAGTRQGGVQALEADLTPYIQGSGTPALDELAKLVSSDPSTLDPQQKLLRENALRDANARLAASGLRGAGRAGVAALNNADVNLMANLYSQNRDRQVAAAQQLASYGFQASGAVGAAKNAAATDIAGNRMSTRATGIQAIKSASDTGASYRTNATATGLQSINSADQAGAQARYAAGNEAAGQALATGQDVNKTQLRLGEAAAANDQDTTRKIAGVNLDVGQKIATRGDQATAATIGATNTAYDQGRTVAGAEGDINAGHADQTGQIALDKTNQIGAANAGAAADKAGVNSSTSIANGKITGETIGAVTSGLSSIFSKAVTPTPTPDTFTPAKTTWV